MRLLEQLVRLGRRGKVANDQAMLDLIRRDPPAGWTLFLDRYSGYLLAWIRDCGFDDDESMERFVFVCEKLAEQNCRRLRQVRHLGDRDELVPWLRQVVNNLLVSWTWSVHGRPRLLKAIEPLPALEQRVFQLHYWQGLAASEVFATLRAEGVDVELIDVYLALGTVQAALTPIKRWRLISRLASRRSPNSLTAFDDLGEFEPPARDPGPEQLALAAEARQQLKAPLSRLAPRHRLVVQLRFEQGLQTREIAELLDDQAPAIRRQLRQALAHLRAELSQHPRSRTA